MVRSYRPNLHRASLSLLKKCMKAARFAVYIDKFVKVKFMDVLDKIGNVDRRVRRIGGNAKRRFDQVDDRMDEIEDKLDEILDQIRKLKELRDQNIV